MAQLLYTCIYQANSDLVVGKAMFPSSVIALRSPFLVVAYDCGSGSFRNKNAAVTWSSGMLACPPLSRNSSSLER